MSIAINGMEMPINCTHCPCSDDETRFCNAAKKYIPMLGKPKFCPLETIEERKTGRWIPCSERLPEEYGEYRITWTTSDAPSKRFIGDSEYEVTSVWDEERKDFKGEWLLDDYIKAYQDVKVIAWKPLEEPYEGEQE